MMEILQELLFQGGEIAVLLFELMALVMIVITGAKGFLSLLRRDGNNVALMLLQGFSIGLSFLLGAEILKTIVLEDVRELLIVGGVVVMRVALSILIHWEMKQEQREQELEERSKKIELANQVIDHHKKKIEWVNQTIDQRKKNEKGQFLVKIPLSMKLPFKRLF